MDTWLLREGRCGEIPLGKSVGSNFTIKTTFGLVWLISLFITSRFLDPQIYPPFLLYLSALATWLEASFNTVAYSLNISLQNQATVVLEVSSSLGLLISTLGLVFIKQNDPMIYALIRLLIACLATVGGLFCFSKISPLSSDSNIVRITLNRILPFVFSDALILIYTQADITILTMILGKQAVGFYSSASSILRAIFVIPSVVYLVMTPVISQLVSERSQRLSRAIW
jgi:O-antigen/teichoic acid export membrane protein